MGVPGVKNHVLLHTTFLGALVYIDFQIFTLLNYFDVSLYVSNIFSIEMSVNSQQHLRFSTGRSSTCTPVASHTKHVVRTPYVLHLLTCSGWCNIRTTSRACVHAHKETGRMMTPQAFEKPDVTVNSNSKSRGWGYNKKLFPFGNNCSGVVSIPLLEIGKIKVALVIVSPTWLLQIHRSRTSKSRPNRILIDYYSDV